MQARFGAALRGKTDVAQVMDHERMLHDRLCWRTTRGYNALMCAYALVVC
jgi:hypothetical protein